MPPFRHQAIESLWCDNTNDVYCFITMLLSELYSIKRDICMKASSTCLCEESVV